MTDANLTQDASVDPWEVVGTHRAEIDRLSRELRRAGNERDRYREALKEIAARDLADGWSLRAIANRALNA